MGLGLEIKLPTKAKSDRQGSDKCSVSLLDILPPQ